ncbi:UNVERIFIED_CONTAM: hypothetical protein Slati_2897500 [Sesamum latifolium]|uniref:Uncharacterized protein n=1 Tax=Sesamum latifolium TaxID=2727402 RepID=A0AAW2VCW4_9LAMI
MFQAFFFLKEGTLLLLWPLLSVPPKERGPCLLWEGRLLLLKGPGLVRRGPRSQVPPFVLPFPSREEKGVPPRSSFRRIIQSLFLYSGGGGSLLSGGFAYGGDLSPLVGGLGEEGCSLFLLKYQGCLQPYQGRLGSEGGGKNQALGEGGCSAKGG